MAGPLTGIRIVEFEGIGPAPYCCMLLADMGAEIVRIARPPTDRGPLILARNDDPIDRGRRVALMDLKSDEGIAAARDLLARADGMVEGLRPGVLERLGLAPADLLAANPRLVICRITGWGQEGPWARTAGHDLSYVALSGALAAMGEPGRPPVPPLNLVGDYGGGGLFAAFGMVSALLHAQRTGQGQVVDAAMLDGAASQMSMIYGLVASGFWTLERGDNLLDGAAPFYRCYTCSDGRFLAVGAIEPQFFAALMEGLELDAAAWDQADKSQWSALAAAIGARIAERSRDDWAAVFDGTDACVAPVLTMAEAADHPHNRARGAFLGDGSDADPVRPAPGPRLSATPLRERSVTHASAAEIVSEWDGFGGG